jgi:hypothetical protein
MSVACVMVADAAGSAVVASVICGTVVVPPVSTILYDAVLGVNPTIGVTKELFHLI